MVLLFLSMCIIIVVFKPFWMGFYKKKIRPLKLTSPGVGRRPRFTFWLTFFQSYMLPLLFSGLLSYLVGMKRRTSRGGEFKKDNSQFLRYVLISPEVENLCWP